MRKQGMATVLKPLSEAVELATKQMKQHPGLAETVDYLPQIVKQAPVVRPTRSNVPGVGGPRLSHYLRAIFDPVADPSKVKIGPGYVIRSSNGPWIPPTEYAKILTAQRNVRKAAPYVVGGTAGGAGAAGLATYALSKKGMDKEATMSAGMGLGMGGMTPWDHAGGFGSRFPMMGGFRWGMGMSPAAGASAAAVRPNPAAQVQQPKVAKADTAGIQAAFSKMGSAPESALSKAASFGVRKLNTGGTPHYGQSDPATVGRMSNVPSSAVPVKQRASVLPSNKFAQTVQRMGKPMPARPEPSVPQPPTQATGTQTKLGASQKVQKHFLDLLSTFAKSAAQDNSKNQRSASGESSGLSYKENDDDYFTGQRAWAASSKYLKDGGKRYEKDPNPFEGDHDGEEKKAGVGGVMGAGLGAGLSQNADPKLQALITILGGLGGAGLGGYGGHALAKKFLGQSPQEKEQAQDAKFDLMGKAAEDYTLEKFAADAGLNDFQASFFYRCLTNGVPFDRLRETVDVAHEKFGADASGELYQGLEKIAALEKQAGPWNTVLNIGKKALGYTDDFARTYGDDALRQWGRRAQHMPMTTMTKGMNMPTQMGAFNKFRQAAQTTMGRGSNLARNVYSTPVGRGASNMALRGTGAYGATTAANSAYAYRNQDQINQLNQMLGQTQDPEMQRQIKERIQGLSQIVNPWDAAMIYGIGGKQGALGGLGGAMMAPSYGLDSRTGMYAGLAMYNPMTRGLMGNQMHRAMTRPFSAGFKGWAAGSTGDLMAGMAGIDTNGRLGQLGGLGGFGMGTPWGRKAMMSTLGPLGAANLQRNVFSFGGLGTKADRLLMPRRFAPAIGGVKQQLGKGMETAGNWLSKEGQPGSWRNSLGSWLSGSGKGLGESGLKTIAQAGKENLGSRMARYGLYGTGAIAGTNAAIDYVGNQAREQAVQGVHEYMGSPEAQQQMAGQVEKMTGMSMDQIKGMAQSAGGMQQLMGQFGNLPDMILGPIMQMFGMDVSQMNPAMKWMMLIGGGSMLGGLFGGGKGAAGGGLGALALPLMMSMMGGFGGSKPQNAAQQAAPTGATNAYDAAGNPVFDPSVPAARNVHQTRNELQAQTS